MYERVRNFREDKDMSQAEIAAYLHVSQAAYSDYELGKTRIPVELLGKLADLHGTSIDYLVNRTDEKTPYPKARKRG